MNKSSSYHIVQTLSYIVILGRFIKIICPRTSTMSSTLSTSSSASKGTVGTWGKGKKHLKRGKSGISRCLKQPVVTAPNETFLKVKRFSKKNWENGFSFLPTSRLLPLASWLSAMLSCFAGGILVSRPTR